jgi:hypothetical protein
MGGTSSRYGEKLDTYKVLASRKEKDYREDLKVDVKVIK